MAISLAAVIHAWGPPPSSIVGPKTAEIGDVDAVGAQALLASTNSSVGAVQNTWYDLVNQDGQGILHYASVYIPAGVAADYQCRLLIDGVQVYLSDTNCWSSGGTFGDGVVIVGAADPPASGAAGPGFGHVPFYSNYTLQARCTSTSLADDFGAHHYAVLM